MAVIELSDNNFESFIESKGLSVVDFWAEWCGPCQVMKPIFKELSEEMGNSVSFGAVDLDENEEIGSSASIMSIPTIIFYFDGVEVERIVGARSKDYLKSTIQKII